MKAPTQRQTANKAEIRNLRRDLSTQDISSHREVNVRKSMLSSQVRSVQIVVDASGFSFTNHSGAEPRGRGVPVSLLPEFPEKLPGRLQTVTSSKCFMLEQVRSLLGLGY